MRGSLKPAHPADTIYSVEAVMGSRLRKTFFSKVGGAGVGETWFPHRRHPEKSKDTLWRAPVWRSEQISGSRQTNRQMNEVTGLKVPKMLLLCEPLKREVCLELCSLSKPEGMVLIADVPFKPL